MHFVMGKRGPPPRPFVFTETALHDHRRSSTSKSTVCVMYIIYRYIPIPSIPGIHNNNNTESSYSVIIICINEIGRHRVNIDHTHNGIITVHGGGERSLSLTIRRRRRWNTRVFIHIYIYMHYVVSIVYLYIIRIHFSHRLWSPQSPKPIRTRKYVQRLIESHFDLFYHSLFVRLNNILYCPIVELLCFEGIIYWTQDITLKV